MIVRKLIVGLICVTSLVGFVLSAAYLLVNLEEIPAQVLQRGLPPAAWLPGNWLPAAFADVLRRISLDLSAVTPFILCWFWGALAWNSGRLLRRAAWNADEIGCRDAFPFSCVSRDYETTWIQLGFIGTLWGFLIIGWQIGQSGQHAPVHEDILHTLMQAFGTALLSTFTAVVMVYVVTPPIRALFRALLRISSNKDDSPETEAVAYLQELTLGLQQSTAAVQTFYAEMERAERQLPAAALETMTTGVAALSSALRSDAEERARRDAALFDALYGMQQTAGGLATALTEHGQRLERQFANLDESLNRQTAALTTSLTEFGAALRQEHQELLTAVNSQTAAVTTCLTEVGATLRQEHQELLTAVNSQTAAVTTCLTEVGATLRQEHQELLTTITSANDLAATRSAALEQRVSLVDQKLNVIHHDQRGQLDGVAMIQRTINSLAENVERLAAGFFQIFRVGEL